MASPYRQCLGSHMIIPEEHLAAGAALTYDYGQKRAKTYTPLYLLHILSKNGGLTMYHCKNLYYLSSIACMLSEHLSEKELEILSADLRTLGEMIESVLTRQTHCGIESED